MTSEMIIRVAKALSEVHKEGGSDLLHYKYSSDEEGYHELAIAAIEAMREPTEDMLDAYWHQTGESKEMRSRTHAYTRRYFAAMINAALEGNNSE